MSACSDPSETRLDVRLVPMTRGMREWLGQLADDYLLNGDAEVLRAHLAEWDAVAPDSQHEWRPSCGGATCARCGIEDR